MIGNPMALDSSYPHGRKMKSQVLLLARVLEDMSIRCRTSTKRDLKKITLRVEDEGLSFLTIALPAFAKDFERGLERGLVDSSLFVGYSKRGCLPAFMRGFTSQVFDPVTGVLLDDPSVEAIHAVRQVCYLFSKVELPCSDTRLNQAFTNYIKCEQSVRDSRLSYDDDLRVAFRRVSNLLFGEMLSKLDRKVADGCVTPKHGPGATADRLRANGKYDNKLWTERLEMVFPAGEFLYSSWRHYFDDLEDGAGPVWLDPGSEVPTRVVSVPKTLKSPRIIAIEPTHMQYVQQGLMELFVDALERPDNLVHGMIGFTDQTPNRTMACHGSREGDLATLDLSEASDRVSYQHVQDMLEYYDWLWSGVDACRSRKADVPGHGIISLAKFASMGSALTFPMEAMVFLTAVFMGIERELNTQCSEKLVKSFSGQVRVYGDDIIIPVDMVPSVIRTLEDLGLEVNAHKSFWTGKFRESCGGDYYNGFDVSVVKVRRSLPSDRKHVQELISAVSLRNQMYFSGCWRTAEYLDRLIEGFIPFPTVHPLSPGLGRHTLLDYEVHRECPHLQRPLVRAAVVASTPPRSDVSWRGALLKHFLKRGDEPFADRKHLERAGRPEAVDIKLRWVTPY